MKRAFTLVEVLLVMVLTGVIVALLMPSLSGARHQAINLGEISKLRQHAMVFKMYTLDHQGWYPNFADPEATQYVIRCGSFVAIEEYYFEQKRWWNFALGDTYYDGVCRGDGFWDPRNPGFWWSEYFYSSTFLARPEFWNKLTRRFGRSQWRGVRDADVLSPARKAIVVHHDSWSRNTSSIYLFPFPPGRKIFFGLVDGAAGLYDKEDLGPWYWTGEGLNAAPGSGGGMPGVHTIDGARGFDLK